MKIRWKSQAESITKDIHPRESHERHGKPFVNRVCTFSIRAIHFSKHGVASECLNHI